MLYNPKHKFSVIVVGYTRRITRNLRDLEEREQRKEKEKEHGLE